MPGKLARKIIDTYAEATRHVDQGLSLTLVLPGYRHHAISTKRKLRVKKGIKTLYYIRLRQQLALEGTEIEGCVSCAL